jgi:polar amino acid transport system substrate-binding protein
MAHGLHFHIRIETVGKIWMFDKPGRWFAVALLAIISVLSSIPARADEARPCEPDKAATRYPSLAGKTIKIGEDGVSLPFNFRDPKNPEQIVGSDADLARAVFKCVGLPVEFVTGIWSGLMPAVAGGRIDVMWDVLYYTPERAKMVDFVLYSTMADRAITQKGNPKNVHSLDDLCGVKAMAGLGTVEIVMLQKISDKCVADGKPALELNTFQDRSQAWQMIETGRVDVMLSNAMIAETISREKPLLEAGFGFLPGIKVGVAVAKGRTELEQALADGLAATQANGEMAKIFEQYKLDPTWILPPSVLTQ